MLMTLESSHHVLLTLSMISTIFAAIYNMKSARKNFKDMLAYKASIQEMLDANIKQIEIMCAQAAQDIEQQCVDSTNATAKLEHRLHEARMRLMDAESYIKKLEDQKKLDNTSLTNWKIGN